MTLGARHRRLGQGKTGERGGSPNTVGSIARGMSLIVAVLLNAVGPAPNALGAPSVPPPTADDFALVKPSWLEEPYPCTLLWFDNHLPEFGACMRVFVSRLPKRDPSRPWHFGPKYDPDEYYRCRIVSPRKNSYDCVPHLLRRPENPEHWPYHAQSPMKWPDPPKESVYREGMTSVDYWRALCKSEAGEFIYRTVTSVPGFFLIRPRAPEQDLAFKERFLMEDPYGYIASESGAMSRIPGMVVGTKKVSRTTGPRYAFLETPPLVRDIHPTRQKYFHPSYFAAPPVERHYERYYLGEKGEHVRARRLTFIREIESKYGVTWRGITRPHDRELGIAGGELAVVDLASGEVLGIRRGFVLGARRANSSVGWGSGNVCPEYDLMPGIGSIRKRGKDVDFSLWFLTKVITPEFEFYD